jgi:hypothetical protein
MADQTDEQKTTAAAEAKAAKAPKGRKVRVLMDTADHKANDVPFLSEDEADAAVAAGWADDHKSAVAYAEVLAKAAE